MPAATRPYGHLDAYVAMLAPHVDPLRSSLRFGLVSPRLATTFKPFGVLVALLRWHHRYKPKYSSDHNQHRDDDDQRAAEDLPFVDAREYFA
jgi:hypothetical protein